MFSQQIYSFTKYKNETKDDWFSIVNQEKTLCINAKDEVLLEKNSDSNLIIYEEGINKKVPVAIFVSNGLSYKLNGFIKILDANFGGLFISKIYIQKAWDVKFFFYHKVVLEYFLKKLNVDFIDFMYPPLAAIETSSLSYISNPTPHAYVNNNSIVYMDLDGDFIQNIKSTPRYEIRKGLKFLNESIVLRSDEKNITEYFLYLDKFKAEKLAINQFTKDYFDELLASKFYKALVCVDNVSLKPLSGVIYSVDGEMGNFIYNSSTDEGKKHYVNKALLFLAMDESKSLGAKYFILGNGYVESGNMLSVTRFKRSMSSNEVECSIYRSPVSLKGKFYTSLLLFRKTQNVA
jgi:hypothetical protein